MMFPLLHDSGEKINEGGLYRDGPDDGFSSSYPFVSRPRPAPFRHSGASRNPGDPFPLGPGFAGATGGGAGAMWGTTAEAGSPPLDSRLRGNDDQVGRQVGDSPMNVVLRKDDRVRRRMKRRRGGGVVNEGQRGRRGTRAVFLGAGLRGGRAVPPGGGVRAEQKYVEE